MAGYTPDKTRSAVSSRWRVSSRHGGTGDVASKEKIGSGGGLVTLHQRLSRQARDTISSIISRFSVVVTGRGSPLCKMFEVGSDQPVFGR